MATGDLILPNVRRLDADEASPFGGVLAKALANYRALTEAQYAPKQALADVLYKNALAKKTQQQANLPFGGANVPGIAGQIAGLEAIKNAYGENSPQYQKASQGFDLEQKSRGSTINYQTKLANSIPIRYTTPEGKGLIEQSNVSQGASPAGTPAGQPVVPGQPGYKSPYSPEDAAGQYELERNKKNIPASVSQKNLYATNIDKTLNMINPDHLTQYGGIKGSMEKRAQEGLSGLGKESENYDNYRKSAQAVEFLTSQVRQFYGDSIQPAMLDRLQKLSDPSAWQTNPKLAKDLFNTTKNILKQEMQTYRSATKNTDVYQGKGDAITKAVKDKIPGKTKTYNLETGKFE